ncbi:hypothetical protein DFP93_104194 [Aneurinibacillus soli]|uniref:Uncharacterized protein n=1 Tax=Aneurinibacillus soli TaxID=1500254 RepID=A0A0U5AXY1_9BACL|nr:hypothetical protein [Aneurinibacillus soli]PYE62544.1 hypothetical protein DFP93_104194 [Aneurinibacillus soli]BAU27106.1 hypothetical protein CB4_01275 [Aneurinibacillus soli]
MFLLLPYLLASIGFGFAIWGKILSTPINHLTFIQLLHEASSHASSVLTSIIKEMTQEKYDIYQMNYDIFWNIELPSILQLIATLFVGSACRLLYQQIQDNTPQRQDVVIKWILLSIMVTMALIFFYNGGKLLLLSLTLLIVMLFILFIPFFLISSLKSERTR